MPSCIGACPGDIGWTLGPDAVCAVTATSPTYPESELNEAKRLAALIDGRLGAEDAEAVRTELADADDATVAAFADAVAISRLGSAEASGELVSISPIGRASERSPERQRRRMRHDWQSGMIPAAARSTRGPAPGSKSTAPIATIRSGQPAIRAWT